MELKLVDGLVLLLMAATLGMVPWNFVVRGRRCGRQFILQHTKADDFVGATSEARFVREFVDVAFRVAGVRKDKNTTEYL